MSRIKNVFLTFLFAFFLFQIFSVISISNCVLAEDIIYGDLNGDGEVNSVDYAMMKQYLLGKIKEFENPNAIKAADVDGNEEINSVDYALIKKYLLGLIKVFPVYEKATPTPTITTTPTPTNSTPSEFIKLKPSIIDVRMSDLNRNSIELLWGEVEGAVYYEVFRDDVSIGTTSDTYFDDVNVIEGMNHIYRIRAVNDLGENSLDSLDVMVNTIDTVIDSDTVLSEDRFYFNLTLKDGAVLDLNGYTLNVKENLLQFKSNVNINTGSLKICGNYTIDKDGLLLMTKDEDYVYVGGDFKVYNGKNDIGTFDYYLTAGVMEVKGDFSCAFDVYNGKFGKYVATGTHKVILSGDKEQVVNNDSGWLVFNELEIKNEKGVKINGITPINIVQGNYKFMDEAMLIIGSIVGDVVIDGNLTIIDQEVDLAGHNLTITGNLNQYSAGRIYSSKDEPFLTKIKVNGGSLKVNGNYTIGCDDELWLFYAPGSILEMTNEDDYVFVGGNFTMASELDHSGHLTAGVLEIKGDFTQSSGQLNFAASGTHKTILSGDSVQTITFEYPETSSFNILKLTKPLDTGYIFSSTPVWKSLEE